MKQIKIKKIDSHQLLSAWEWNTLKHNYYEKKKQIIPCYNYLKKIKSTKLKVERKENKEIMKCITYLQNVFKNLTYC